MSAGPWRFERGKWYAPCAMVPVVDRKEAVVVQNCTGCDRDLYHGRDIKYCDKCHRSMLSRQRIELGAAQTAEEIREEYLRGHRDGWAAAVAACKSKLEGV
jgi:hypothetical protein